MDIIYKNVREVLDEPLQFEVVDPYKYNDGYADPSKLVVLRQRLDGFIQHYLMTLLMKIFFLKIKLIQMVTVMKTANLKY